MHYQPPTEVARRGASIGLGPFLYVDGFLGKHGASRLLSHCLSALDWQQEGIELFGRTTAMPRLTTCYSDSGCSYRYSGLRRYGIAWTEELSATRDLLVREVGALFNYMLGNRYRSGADCVGWHSDDETDLGDEPVIASLSLGATRRFRVRCRSAPASVGLDLTHGSLLIMWGLSQQDFKHCLTRTRRAVGERVNLSFRLVA